MKQSRGQVTLEFLFTYGWAILIILIVAVVLWQMGVFNVGGRVEPGASGFWGVIPQSDVAYSSTGSDGILIIGISNQVGGNITLNGVNATVQGQKYVAADSYVITPGETYKWVSPSPWASEDGSTNMPELPAGTSFNIFVTLDYTDNRVNQNFISSGWIWGNVEEEGAS